MAYELLWDASYEYLEKHAAFVNTLTNLMLARAKNLRSQLFSNELVKSPTFLEEFKLAHDELQNMNKTLQLVVNDWKSLFAEVSSRWTIQTGPQSIASNAELTFDYIRPTLDYKANEKVQLIVTYIPVPSDGIFYAMDESRKNDFSANLMPIQTTRKTLLDKSPPPGTVFMILLDNMWTRAVCSVFTNGKTPQAIYLLDLGEILCYDEHVPKAVLPAVLSSVPAYAMKCSIVPNTASFSLKLYETVNCTVMGVENDMLVVEHNEEKQEYSITRETSKEEDLKQEGKRTTNATEITNNEEKQEYSITRETSKEADSKQQEGQSTTNATEITNNEEKKECLISKEMSTEAESERQGDASSTQAKKLAPSEERQEYAITRETFTEEELEQLDDISQSTTNAMKAVLGYVPTDDDRLCKHYNPKTNGCFKGSNCRLRHEPKDPNGWTLDKDTVSVSVPAQMEMPLPNTYVTLHTTCIIDVDTFYAHVIRDSSDYSKYEQLMSEMNDPEVVANYKPLKLMPALGELVIAKYEDLWYRATVCDAFDRAVSVFYVDYGNTAMVGSNEVRRWEDRFKYIPFQAVCCRISNIQRIKPCHLEAIQQLYSSILDKQLRAMIIDNKHPWEVILYDKDNFDIGEQLIKANLALPRKPCRFDENSYIPG
ncbi:tudor domain-containing 6-like [Anopheles marshallii]|uniref:tudor domain-containing 6-like n=1 Tax=Anopheles marshallii TaxID=1521116 RepID=UPI00237C1196|nr:tudor domain-containing 6-like [Anopheles marshallii]